MKFAVTNDQRHYFDENGYLECESMLSEEVINLLSQVITGLVKGKGRPYSAGRDLWRHSKLIERTSGNRSYANIFSELTNTNTVALACDQLVGGKDMPATATLAELMPFQGLIGGLILKIEGDDKEPIAGRPSVCGSGVFVRAESIIPLDVMGGDFRYLLIVYGGRRLVYCKNPNDPHTNSLKELGYGFGDSLKGSTHPVLHR